MLFIAASYAFSHLYLWNATLSNENLMASYSNSKKIVFSLSQTNFQINKYPFVYGILIWCITKWFATKLRAGISMHTIMMNGSPSKCRTLRYFIREIITLNTMSLECDAQQWYTTFRFILAIFSQKPKINHKTASHCSHIIYWATGFGFVVDINLWSLTNCEFYAHIIDGQRERKKDNLLVTQPVRQSHMNVFFFS